MKKFSALALAAMMAVTASAAESLYITGSGEFTNGAWNAVTPDQFELKGGNYVIDVANLTEFKISTQAGSWDDFNAGVYGCIYGDTPGVAVPLNAGWVDNIKCPFKGDYTVTVAGDLSTITLETKAVAPTGPADIYLRGDMNAWKAEPAWKLESVGENLWKFTCSEDQAIAAGEAFKIADGDWFQYNIGGNGDPVALEYAYEVYNGDNPQNLTLAEAFNGVLWFVMDMDGANYIELSNDKSYVPEWGQTTNPPTPPTPPTPGETLYITGDGEFANEAWNAETPDEFEVVDGNYVIEVKNLSQFKISTTCGDWDLFNAGALTCTYGDELGVAVALVSGDSNILCPWKGDYKIVVAGDLSTVTLTTATPKPEGPTPIYLRGDMNAWGTNEAWQLEEVDTNLWKFTCSEDQEIAVGETFKIADEGWVRYNFGGNGDPVLLENAYEVYYNSNQNLVLEEAFNGVLWFVMDLDGKNYIELSNDKDYVPTWGTNPNPPTPPTPGETLYITGDGEFANEAWNAETPDEFEVVDGNYVIEVKNLSQFKISTTCGDWDLFNAGALTCTYGDELGVAVALVSGDSNILCPWKGDYKIVVTGDLSTITLTTATPKPEGPTPIYLRGAMNEWKADEAWQLEQVEDNLWKFTCAEEQVIAPDEAFKIADADWSKYNFGGETDLPVEFESAYEVYNAGNSMNLTVTEDFNGVLWFIIDKDGANYIELSNDKDYVPTWGENPNPPTPPTPGDALYITGDGEFVNGTWNAETPDEFELVDGNYVMEVANLSQFKLSTSCGDWDEFNAGSLTCYNGTYGDEPGVTVELLPGDRTILCPWPGDYKIVVAGDLSTIILTTDTPKPEGLNDIYLRGGMNEWGVDEAWKMEQVEDNLWKFTCSEDQSIPADVAFKIADKDWTRYNYGGNGDVVLQETVYEVYHNSLDNLVLAEEFNGVIWFVKDLEGANYIELSNDKDYLPSWSVPAPPAPETPLYITGAGDFANGEWNPVIPDEFEIVGSNYVIEVTNLSRFKISTTCGDWTTFNEGALWCDYGEVPGVKVALELSDKDINTPWIGDYKVIVSGDLSTITLVTTTPAPEPGEPTPLYLRGKMNSWAADDAWMMEKMDGDVWRFVCSDDQAIEADMEFKIADSAWNAYNIGAADDRMVYLNTEVLAWNSANPANFMMGEDFNGVLWLSLYGDGLGHIELSNDRYYVPEWYTGYVGVDGVYSVDPEADYYTLDGVKVKNPTHGIYIVIKDGKVSKVVR